MIKEFEGRNEEEAIKNAIEFLGLTKSDIDVEIVEKEKGGFLFKGGKVKIRVHYDENDEEYNATGDPEKRIISFVSGLIDRMGLEVEVKVHGRRENRLELDLVSPDSGIIIGKQGKTLEAIQLLTNIVVGRVASDDYKVVIDSEGYKKRRERNIEQIARRVASQVRKSKGSRLLEPMNPFERRIVHTTLSSYKDIETISEGEGLYKQVRIMYRGDIDRY